MNPRDGIQWTAGSNLSCHTGVSGPPALMLIVYQFSRLSWWLQSVGDGTRYDFRLASWVTHTSALTGEADVGRQILSYLDRPDGAEGSAP